MWMFNANSAGRTGHTVAAGSVLAVHPEDAVLVAAERDRLAMFLQIGTGSSGSNQTPFRGDDRSSINRLVASSTKASSVHGGRVSNHAAPSVRSAPVRQAIAPPGAADAARRDAAPSLIRSGRAIGSKDRSRMPPAWPAAPAGELTAGGFRMHGTSDARSGAGTARRGAQPAPGAPAALRVLAASGMHYGRPAWPGCIAGGWPGSSLTSSPSHRAGRLHCGGRGREARRNRLTAQIEAMAARLDIGSRGGGMQTMRGMALVNAASLIAELGGLLALCPIHAS